MSSPAATARRTSFSCALVAEHRQQSVALDRADVALISIDDPAHIILVAADQGAIRLRFQTGGQHRRVDEVGEHDCQSAEFTVVSRRGEQVLGFRVAAVDRKNPPGQRGRGSTVAFIDGPHRAVQQFVDRCTALARDHLLLLPGIGSGYRSVLPFSAPVK
jgi:hypothetical protein